MATRPPKRHIGDGAYGEYENGSYVLTTERRRDGKIVTDTIVLGWRERENLEQLFKEVDEWLATPDEEEEDAALPD